MMIHKFLFTICLIFLIGEIYNANADVPMECPLYYRRKCDTTGKVYDNICEFYKAKSQNPSLQVQDCKDSCIRWCYKNLKIVCDKKGVKFPNECIFEVAKCVDPSRELAPCPAKKGAKLLN